MVLRIFIALILSGLIGFERELKNHSAGFRTHILVGVGSCLMMLLSLYGFESFIEEYDNVRFDPARIPSYVISGIGFLGAGTIMVHGMTIRGLTTAASIWTVAGLGLVVGAGMYSAAVLTTFVILLSLVLLHHVENFFMNKRSNIHFKLVVSEELRMESLIRLFEIYNVKLRKLEVEKEENKDRIYLIQVESTMKIDKFRLLDDISTLNHVKKVNEQ
ncbi:MgtC/SapB family protein [Sediminibacillus massiliensis]|uniref:MgtC/SapB family protein n=1 Tax=Sediminibacillus massiliensis TaxID=1926277 RepID=UPI0015C2C515